MIFCIGIVKRDGKEVGIKIVDTDNVTEYNLHSTLEEIENKGIKIENAVVKEGKLIITQGRKEDYPYYEGNKAFNKDNITLLGYYNTGNNEKVYIVANGLGVIESLYREDIEDSKITNCSVEDGNLILNESIKFIGNDDLMCRIVGKGVNTDDIVKVGVITNNDTIVIDGEDVELESIIDIQIIGNSINRFRLGKLEFNNISLTEFKFKHRGIMEVKLGTNITDTLHSAFNNLNNLRKFIIGVEGNIETYGDISINSIMSKVSTIEILGECYIKEFYSKNNIFDYRPLFNDTRVIVGNFYVENNKVVKDLVVHEGYRAVRIDDFKGIKSLEIKGLSSIERSYSSRDKKVTYDIICRYDYPYKELEKVCRKVIRREPSEDDLRVENSSKRMKFQMLYGTSTYDIKKDAKSINTVLKVIDKGKIEKQFREVINLILSGGKKYNLSIIGEYGYYFELYISMWIQVIEVNKVIDLEDYIIAEVKTTGSVVYSDELDKEIIVLPKTYKALERVMHTDSNYRAEIRIIEMRLDKEELEYAYQENIDKIRLVYKDGSSNTISIN